jgi:hypothetical protein
VLTVDADRDRYVLQLGKARRLDEAQAFLQQLRLVSERHPGWSCAFNAALGGLNEWLRSTYGAPLALRPL